MFVVFFSLTINYDSFMGETKKTPEQEAREFKSRFEFRLTVGDNIICQRYFKIPFFNPTSLCSYDLANIVRYCAKLIDDNLKLKTQIYLESVAPRIFQTEAEMRKYLSNPKNWSGMVLGESIVVLDSAKEFAWGKGNTPILSPTKLNAKTAEIFTPLTDEDMVTYKFAFLDSEREAVATTWTGIYPKFVRNKIDLSNRKYIHEESELPFLNYEDYLLHRMSVNGIDLNWKICKELSNACSYKDNEDYTTEDSFGGTKYSNMEPKWTAEEFRYASRQKAKES